MMYKISIRDLSAPENSPAHYWVCDNEVTTKEQTNKIVKNLVDIGFDLETEIKIEEIHSQ